MKRSSILLVAVIILLGAMVGIGVFRLTGNYLAGKAPSGSVACKTIGRTQTFTVEHDSISPKHMYATLCDQLVVVNKDAVIREMAFGEHENHQPYNGVTEQLLQQGQSFSLVLNKTGTYKIHDHIHDEVAADFTVAN